MPTVFTHPLVALGAWPWVKSEKAPRTLLVVVTACTIVPDLDVVGLHLGIPYGSLFGHRGFSHSLIFAAILATLLAAALRYRFRELSPGTALAFLFICTASHGVLDALTSGGLGIAFFSPFSNERYFFPWRPIQVSPLSLRRFLSASGEIVLLSELRWVALPCAAVALAGLAYRRCRINHACEPTKKRSDGAS